MFDIMLVLRTVLIYSNDAPITIPISRLRRIVDLRLQEVADWFKAQLGVTFDVTTRICPLRVPWHTVWMPDSLKLKRYLFNLCVERGHLNRCDPRQITNMILYRTPQPVGGPGNMIGAQEMGCSFWRPGVTGLSAWEAWALAGYPPSPAFPVPDSRYGKASQAQGRVAHEVNHCLTGDPHTGSEVADLLGPDCDNFPDTYISDVNDNREHLVKALTPPHLGYFGNP